MTTHDLTRDLSLLDRDLIDWRRDLHQHPELGFAEQRTSTFVAERLTALGLDVRTKVGQTGIVADLSGRSAGPTLLIRADMDALPIQERALGDYSSRVPGVMHACGHDAHVSALLGAATLLAARRNQFAGRVRFLFQPAEEFWGGAQAMIAEGALDSVDRVLGAHVFAPAPFGSVLLRPGAFLAGGDAFELTIIGQAGHGGMPQSSVDPVFAAAQVVTALQSIVARETDPRDALVVSVAAIQGGSAANVIVEEVTLRGTIRWFTAPQRERTLTRLQEIAAGVCTALRTHYTFRVTGTTPVTASVAAEVDVVQEAVMTTGRATVVDPGPVTASEDFAYFLERVPGCFFGVGAGGPTAAPHHHPAFAIDERAIGLMTEVFTRVTLVALAPADPPA